MSKLEKLVNPFKLVQVIKNRFWFWVAQQLRFYLAHTYIIWGDKKRVSIGKNVHLSDGVLNTRSGCIIIEDEVFFGHNVLIVTGWHDYRLRGMDRIKTVPETGSDIIIRHGAWVASHVTVLGPCEIGENSVIAAGAVVFGKIPPNTIYGGVPAKFIKNIDYYPEAVQIEAVQREAADK